MSASEAGGSSGTSGAGSDAEEPEAMETDAGGAPELPLSMELIVALGDGRSGAVPPALASKLKEHQRAGAAWLAQGSRCRSNSFSLTSAKIMVGLVG